MATFQIVKNDSARYVYPSGPMLGDELPVFGRLERMPETGDVLCIDSGCWVFGGVWPLDGGFEAWIKQQL